MSALALSAVGCLEGQLGVALSANHFFNLILPGKGSESWLDFALSETTTAKSQDQVEG